MSCFISTLVSWLLLWQINRKHLFSSYFHRRLFLRLLLTFFSCFFCCGFFSSLCCITCLFFTFLRNSCCILGIFTSWCTLCFFSSGFCLHFLTRFLHLSNI